MSVHPRRLRRCVVAFAVASALLAAGPHAGSAQGRAVFPSAPWHATSQAPLRAVFSSGAPARSVRGRPAPLTASAIAGHLAALRWARADAAIVPWSRPGSAADRSLGALLAAGAATLPRVQVAAVIHRRAGSEASQMKALAARRTSAPAYLHVASRPAVFVALADRGARQCGAARRWRAAAVGYWLAQADLRRLRALPAAQPTPGSPMRTNARSTQAPGTFVIRPGFWPGGARRRDCRARLRAGARRWRA